MERELFEIDQTREQRSIRRLEKIPIPPSANDMYKMTINRGGKGKYRRVRTKEYEGWRSRAAWVVASQVFDHLRRKTPYAIRIRVHLNRRGDISNRIKCFEDMLQYAGIIHDDRYCDSLTIERDLTLPEGTISAEISGDWFRE